MGRIRENRGRRINRIVTGKTENVTDVPLLFFLTVHASVSKIDRSGAPFRSQFLVFAQYVTAVIHSRTSGK